MDFNNMKDFGFEDLNVRKSVFDMQVITLDTPYLGGLPPELEKFHYYFSHEGHVLMVIPRNYLKIALESGDLDDYEIQIPVKYVLEKGYEFVEGHLDYIVGNFDYDDELQKVDVPAEHYEYYKLLPGRELRPHSLPDLFRRSYL